MERLDKLLASTGRFTRREAKELIRTGRVTVDGRPAAAPEEREAPSAVVRLPEKYRLPIHLYYYEGYSVAEIAEILKLGQSAVKMRLKRGREQLKLDLEGAK